MHQDFKAGASTAASHTKIPAAARHPTWILDKVSATPLPIQLPSNSLEKQKMAQVLGLCTHMRNPKKAPGYQLQPSLPLAAAATSGVNQQTEEL